MSSDVYVTFGGDTSQLQATCASAKAAVSALTRDLADLARQQQTALRAGADHAAVDAKMLEMSARLNEAREAAAKAGEALRKQGEDAEKGGEGVAALKERVDQVKESFLKLAEIAGVAISVDAFKEWVDEATEAAAKIESDAAKIGASFGQIQQLQGFSTLTDTDYGELLSQFERLQLALTKIGDKSSPAAAGLKALGINAAEFRRQSSAEQWETLAAAEARFADGTGKTAATVALLGRAGADAIPFLDKGKEGFEELNEVLERTGYVMSADTVAAIATLRDHLQELKLAWAGDSRSLFAALAPAIDYAVQSANQLMETFRGGDLRTFAVLALDAMADLRVSTVADGEAFKALGEDIKGAFDWIADGAGKVGSFLDKVSERLNAIAAAHLAADQAAAKGSLLGGGAPAPAPTAGPGSPYGALTLAPFATGYGSLYPPPTQTGADVVAENALRAGYNISQAREEAEQLKQKIESVYKLAPTTARSEAALGGAAYNGPSALPQVRQFDLGGAGRDTAGRDAEQAFEKEVQAAQNAEKKIETTLDARLRLHQTTMAEWAKDSVAALAAESAAIAAAGKEAQASAALTSEQKTALWDKEQKYQTEIADKIVADQTKAAEEVQKQWDAVFKSVNGALEGQVKGLLAGTESLGTAGAKIAGDLAESAIKSGLNSALTGAENLGMKALGIGQGVTKDAAITANTGALATLTGAIAANTAALGGSVPVIAANTVATAGSGVANDANTGATLVNTVATNLATAAHFFGIPGFAAGTPFVQKTGVALVHKGERIIPAAENIGSFEVGTWGVPRDMLAAVHKDEPILPAGSGIGGALRDLAGGGAAAAPPHEFHAHFNVSAIDAAGMSDYFNQHAGSIAEALHSAFRDGHPSALAMASGR
jgi:hypothetical protein